MRRRRRCLETVRDLSLSLSLSLRSISLSPHTHTHTLTQVHQNVLKNHQPTHQKKKVIHLIGTRIIQQLRR
ncbi:hypothetical protein OAV88_00965 [bacterium]|nr:hypothetical protein [bacterium]